MQIPFNIKDETIYLTADDNNYCLSRKRERNKGTEIITELESFKWFQILATH